MSRTPSRPSTPPPPLKGGAQKGPAKLGPQPAPQRLAVPAKLGAQPAPKRLTPSGATVGGPTKLTAAPKQGAAGKPLTAPAVGGATPAFKTAGVGNPMGRGGKPGLAIGNAHRR